MYSINDSVLSLNWIERVNGECFRSIYSIPLRMSILERRIYLVLFASFATNQLISFLAKPKHVQNCLYVISCHVKLYTSRLCFMPKIRVASVVFWSLISYVELVVHIVIVFISKCIITKKTNTLMFTTSREKNCSYFKIIPKRIMMALASAHT